MGRVGRVCAVRAGTALAVAFALLGACGQDAPGGDAGTSPPPGAGGTMALAGSGGVPVAGTSPMLTGGAGAAGAGGMTAPDAGAQDSGLPMGPGCSTTLAPPVAHTVTQRSDMVIDYALSGAPAERHFDIALLMFDGTSLDASTPPPYERSKAFYSPQELGDAFFDDPNGVAAFLAESSYGRVSLAGSVVGWIDIGPQMVAADDFRERREYYAGLAKPYVNLADYDVVYIVALTDADDVLQLGWSLMDMLDGHMSGIVWMINSEFWTEPGFPGVASVILPSTSWAHELHHTFGAFGHALSLDCGMQATGVGSECALVPYGNPYSVMGAFGYALHADLYMKQALGWLDAGQITEVTATGDHMLCPIETADGRAKGLSIALSQPLIIKGGDGTDVPFDRVRVEYRRALGFDRYMERLLGSNYLDYFLGKGLSVETDGVLVSLAYANPDTESSVLIDAHPDTPFNMKAGVKVAGDAGKFADAFVLVGETFELNGVRITPESLTVDGGIAVHVEVGAP